jgi:acyl-CoA reductase-like NAD-dependent aldehyde dehydrogenase
LLEEVVLAANNAFKTWGRTTLEERKKALKAFADDYAANIPELSKILAAETGKPVRAPS